MPGVPKSRACDACRKQKKKCDELTPTCSRCRRLQLECMGSGVQRYKFHQMDETLAAGQKAVILARPSNKATMLTGELASIFQITDDRYDLSIYGSFMRDIPCRIGSNPALDASAQVLALSFPITYTHQQSPEMVEAFLQALSTIRKTLKNPKRMKEPETICAVYLIFLCQNWLKMEGQFPDHCDALAHLLEQAALAQDWVGNFEQQMLIEISFVVTLNNLKNPRTSLDSDGWARVLDKIETQTTSSDSLFGITFLRHRKLTRLVATLRDFDNHILEILAAYKQLEVDIKQLSQILAAAPAQIGPSTPKTFILFLVAYSTTLMLYLVINIALRNRYPAELSRFAEDSRFHIQEVISIADRSSPYRPIGSSSIPMSIVSALLLAEGKEKLILAEYLEQWNKSLPGVGWAKMAVWVENCLNETRKDEEIPKIVPGFEEYGNAYRWLKPAVS